MHYAQQLITEQRAIASELRKMIRDVEAGVDAALLLTGDSFHEVLQRLQIAQRAQSELLNATTCAEVMRRQYPTLVAQDEQMMKLLEDLQARAAPSPAAPPSRGPPPPPPQFQSGVGEDHHRPFF
jgi:protein-disulfide isomerase-like protein with CxxC motif